MSRIGRKPVTVPAGVKVQVNASTRTVDLQGPKGKLQFTHRPEVKVSYSDADKAIVCEMDPAIVDLGSNKATWGTTRSVLIGKRGPEREVPPPPDAAPGTPPRALPQAWARTADHPEVYLVDETLIDVCRDLRREASRKAESDAQKSERHERIEKERSGGDGPR